PCGPPHPALSTVTLAHVGLPIPIKNVTELNSETMLEWICTTPLWSVSAAFRAAALMRYQSESRTLDDGSLGPTHVPWAFPSPGLGSPTQLLLGQSAPTSQVALTL